MAGESGGNDINHAFIAVGVPVSDELSDIAEDRGAVEDFVFDPLGNDFLAVVIYLYVSDRSPSEQSGAVNTAPTACKEG